MRLAHVLSVGASNAPATTVDVLLTVSGIPFGLTGQMLDGGGNPWRGMLYAITNRPGWAGDPSHIWKFWDACRIQEKRMIGYWQDSPVTCTNDSVRVTLYRGEEESILAVGNWGKSDQTATITIDWKKLGYDPSTCAMTIHSIPDFQDEQALASLERLRIPARKGYLISVDAVP